MTQTELEQGLPQYPESYWRESVDVPEFRQLEENTNADAVIVGGGITGITAAYLLAKQGVNVVLLEADKLLNGTTGHTTAKITAQHGLIYDELIHHVGKSRARLYYEANRDALEWIRKTVNAEQIDCDLSEQDATIYATTDPYAHKLEKEHKAYDKLNIDGVLTGEIPFDIEVKKALTMNNQAQFHPVKYLARLVSEIIDNGGRIFEQTTAVDVDDGNTVVTREGYQIKGNTVLACTHYPFYDGMGIYYSRMHASRSYIVAVKTHKDYPGGMYISADQPTRSLRLVPTNDEQRLVLIVGENHKTGQGKDTLEHYEALESFGKDLFGDIEVAYRWSAQDLVTLDKIPYIGQITSARPNVLVATGYRKWGMSSGTAAAQLLADLVLNKENPYRKLFDPSRFFADPSLKTFLKQNMNVAGHLIKGKFELNGKKAEDLSPDEGGVVLFHGERAGAYKNDEGQIHVVDTTCTHLGCEVEWNHGDRTWDCPCHGSRFSYTGEVVEGPAEEPLKRLE